MNSYYYMLFINLGFMVGIALSTDETEPPDRQEKIILFDVVKFPNDPCLGEDPFGRVGTCYSRRECREKNGTAVAQCAEGYGVCCIFELDCGGKTSENITHFTKSVGEAAALTGKCEADVCRVTENICQLRLDFTSFVLAGPSTDTQTTHFTSFGEPVSSGAPNRIAQTSIGQCIQDRFTARPSVGIKVPTICGINTGQHIYVDISDPEEECSTLAFEFKDREITRQWNITILQISCDYENKAPPGCLQYFFGLNEDGVGGVIKSFNFDGGYHLASQNQFVCVRREENYCSICYAQVDNQNFQDFGISTGKRLACTYQFSQNTCGGPQDPKIPLKPSLKGQSWNQQRAETLMTVTGWIRGSFGNCGGYGLKGNGADFDYVKVNKPVHAVNEFRGVGFTDVQCGNGNVCGRNTSGPGICSASYPFNLRFVSDSTEAEFEHLSATPNNRKQPLPSGSKGFRFGYKQEICRSEKCFQCLILGFDDNLNLEQSCLGPHFSRNHRGQKFAKGTTGVSKVYQPFNGPTIPCDKSVYSSDNDMGTITFPSDGSDLSIDLNCYFKIEVSNGKKVMINFRKFNIGEGVDYGITTLYPAYKLDKDTVTCGDGSTEESCGECPKPTSDDDTNCAAIDGDCVVKKFTTAINPVINPDYSDEDNLQEEFFCTNKIIDADRKWCHGNNDFLQIDQKTMFDFSDPGSAQNRFCGTDLPRIGGIQNRHFYISEGSQLIIWLKTNSDLKVGTGFQLDWREYDCPKNKPILDQGTCVATCPPERSFNDQLICMDACPAERSFIDLEKTCVATCPTTRPNDQGSCVTTCPEDRPFNDQGTCEEACPTQRPIYDLGEVPLGVPTCVATCPDARPNDPVTNECVTTCPQDRSFTDLNICVNVCPPNDRSIIDVGKTCVASCPINANILLARFNDQGTCVTPCPEDRPNIETIMNVHSINDDTCVETCSANFPFVSPPYNYCAKQCQDGWTPNLSKVCVEDLKTTTPLPPQPPPYYPY